MERSKCQAKMKWQSPCDTEFTNWLVILVNITYILCLIILAYIFSAIYFIHNSPPSAQYQMSGVSINTHTHTV